MTRRPLNRMLIKRDYAKMANKIEEFISASVIKSTAKGVVIGLSGGLDSSVVLKLSARAIGPKRVTGIIMPTRSTPKEDIEHAVELAEATRIQSRFVDIQSLVDQYISLLCANDKKAIGNVIARIRMTILYYHAFVQGSLVVGTGDKSEYYIGYFTKYGDGGADIMPIADLYKTQVKELAKYLRVPDEIVHKKSSPRLWANQLAEDEIGMNYEIVDSILYLMIDKKLKPKVVAVKLNLPLELVVRIFDMMSTTAHKRKLHEIAYV